MKQDIHGHTVLNLLLNAEAPLSRSQLEGMIESDFGGEVCFHTCSQQGLTLTELLDFLLSKKKVVELESGLTVNPERICHH
ncbi:YecH family protein [Aliivibrio sp. S4TY2]|uniref:YecH family metal-binding protein n=1 Tax=unclassified Aliivibrio TaxID=2645654 RepID=UPI0023780352|nr:MULTISPECIES: YecH family metal-binding protein [unclassified Aliivibrio]MDD9157748.1 YecH family protein [Aliivibrio sp. S4TY2]MDD9161719.1 YecH family protein [Aliivibrio sp. S4TY1]MDD9165749.1 YecH family protein [Aliivibrio sp. S4MY2]MDD9169748.1 YecH family protein [Aliivibrio sp. S4MY4]MDD9186772.1 YecH family protein [Aliivibrio sp. S4MY3]